MALNTSAPCCICISQSYSVKHHQQASMRSSFSAPLYHEHHLLRFKLPYFPAYNMRVIYTKRIWNRKEWTCVVYVRKISNR